MNESSNSLFAFDAIGTHWEIETFDPISELLKQKILDRIALFDKTYSRFRSDSLVSKIAAAIDGGVFEFPDDCIPLFNLYDRLYHLTGGAVDPLVGRRLEELGYDRNYSLIPATATKDAKPATDPPPRWVKDIIRNHRIVTTQRPLVIDLGAAGKGYLVDIISELLLAEQVFEFIIDAGGDMRHCGDWDLPVGMEHPIKAEHVIGVIDLRNNALCASATNRRAWAEGLHHIVDSRTGQPAGDVAATWVVAKNAMIADGLATALFFVHADQLKGHFSFSSVRMFADDTIERSKNFKGEMFFKESSPLPNTSTKN